MLQLFPIVTTIVMCLALQSCGNTEEGSTNDKSVYSFVSKIENAHNKDAWKHAAGFKFHIYLEFRGAKRLAGDIIMETLGSKVRMELDNGITAYFDGTDAWYAPDTASFADARFNIRTWSYFLEAAMKLSDSGSKMVDLGITTLNGKRYYAGKMTFDDGVGDSPDDWYIAYADTGTNRLEVLAYIVTYKKSVKEANKDPHAIVYTMYKDVEGIPIATKWDFYEWREDSGLTNKLGTGRISNMQFTNISDSLFVPPACAVNAPFIQ